MTTKPRGPLARVLWDAKPKRTTTRRYRKRRARPRYPVHHYSAPTMDDARVMIQTYVGDYTHDALRGREPRHYASIMAEVLRRLRIYGRAYTARWLWNAHAARVVRHHSTRQHTTPNAIDRACAICKASRKKCPMHRKH